MKYVSVVGPSVARVSATDDLPALPITDSPKGVEDEIEAAYGGAPYYCENALDAETVLKDLISDLPRGTISRFPKRLRLLIEHVLEDKSHLALAIASKCNVLRIQGGLSQEELAERASVSTDVVWRIEGAEGKRGATIGSIADVFSCLGSPLEFILHHDNIIKTVRLEDGETGKAFASKVILTARQLSMLSVSDLDKRLGKGKGYTSRLERTSSIFRSGPTLKTLEQVMAACSISVKIRPASC